MSASLDDISALLPSSCFAFELPLYPTEKKRELKKRHLLPDFSELADEISFATMHAGYSEEGVRFDVEVSKPFEDIHDSVELFIDTRAMKNAGFPTRFCHHFLIFPQAVDGIIAQEITRFRTEDAHPLCNPDDLKVHGEVGRRKWAVQIFIPSQCLHGYDPTAFKKMGFAYRINRQGGEPQHFTLSSRYIAIEQHPSLWSTLNFVEE